jgi:TPR repeat protein
MHYSGLGVLRNYAEAGKWVRKAADQGNADAQGFLGLMYDKGEGVAQNHAEAAKWYRLAANQGNADAQGFLGFMYSKGEGVPQNYVLAHMWFNLAAANPASDKEHRDNMVHMRDHARRSIRPAGATATRLGRSRPAR